MGWVWTQQIALRVKESRTGLQINVNIKLSRCLLESGHTNIAQ